MHPGKININATKSNWFLVPFNGGESRALRIYWDGRNAGVFACKNINIGWTRNSHNITAKWFLIIIIFLYKFGYKPHFSPGQNVAFSIS